MGLLAYLTGTNEDRLVTDTGGALTGMSSRRSSPWKPSARANGRSTRFGSHHYRDNAQREVHLVLDELRREIGVEVKAAATAGERDFRGLEFLRGKLGRRFKARAGPQDGDKTLPSATGCSGTDRGLVA